MQNFVLLGYLVNFVINFTKSELMFAQMNDSIEVKCMLGNCQVTDVLDVLKKTA